MESGVLGFTFVKTTQSGWADHMEDPCTTLAETEGRFTATAMEARWP